MERFAAIDVNTIALFPANTSNSLGQPYCRYPANRLWFDTWDFTVVGRQFDDVLEHNPRANFIVIVDLNSPEWLSRQLALSHESGDSTTHLSETLVNPRWLCDTEHYLEAFLSYCEKNYAEKIEAYVLACGNTDEWFDHNGELCGLAKERAYQEYRARNGQPPETPPSAGKLNSPDFDGLVFDPARSDDVITYRRFCNELVAESILRFARFSRKVIRPEAEIGVFYGYLTTRLGAAESGHVELRRVLDAPEVDFLISPGCYIDRAIGGGSGWQSVSGSERLAGKRHLHECDQRTHTSNHYLTPYITLKAPGEWEDEASTLAGLKREASLALLKQANLWWFDMWGDFYQGEAVMKLLKQIRGLWNSYAGNVGADRSETALIVDPESTYLVNENHPVSGEIHLGMRNKLNRLGAPFEVYSFRDIPRIADFERFRLLIFNSAFLITPEKQEILKRFVLCGGRTVLWLCAPGITDGVRFAPERCGALTGIPYGTDGVTARSMGDWTSVYCHDYRTVTPALLRELASAAGVRLVAERELPVVFSGSLLSVHTKEGGRMSLHVPEEFRAARELFTGTSLSVKNGILEYTFQTPDTGLFDLFRSAETEASEPV